MKSSSRLNVETADAVIPIEQAADGQVNDPPAPETTQTTRRFVRADNLCLRNAGCLQQNEYLHLNF